MFPPLETFPVVDRLRGGIFILPWPLSKDGVLAVNEHVDSSIPAAAPFGNDFQGSNRGSHSMAIIMSTKSMRFTFLQTSGICTTERQRE